jgi:hypothetical protein
LMGALQLARKGGHERLAGYLEAVADDVVFEAEAAARTSDNPLSKKFGERSFYEVG